jgi:outer membrane immunogenic protein
MQKTLVAATLATLVGVAGTANAADIYAPSASGYKDVVVVAPTWTGFYLGAHVGGAWSNIDITDYTAAGGIFSTGSFSGSAVIGGGQLGYNWQRDAFVLGVEADLGGVGNLGSVDRPDLAALHPHYQTDGSFIGDITGRVGYAVGSALFYAKGGGAFLNGDWKVDYLAVNDFYSAKGTLWGWTVGGGIEYQVTPVWSVKAEYQYIGFNDVTVPTPREGGYGRFSNLDLNTFTVGVNYHLVSGYTPLK